MSRASEDADRWLANLDQDVQSGARTHRGKEGSGLRPEAFDFGLCSGFAST